MVFTVAESKNLLPVVFLRLSLSVFRIRIYKTKRRKVYFFYRINAAKITRLLTFLQFSQKLAMKSVSAAILAV